MDQKTQAMAARRTWLGLLAVLLGLWALADWVQQPQPPRGLDAPSDRFSEARAMPVVRKLADELGPHPVGSAQGLAAAAYLAGELAKIPRVEVELQDVEGDTRLHVWPDVNFHYRVRNVVARLKGRRPDALLLNAHYDSPVEGPGGSDNGIGTAAMVEVLRALASGPELEWTVVVCLNGGEEAGSGGAAGFLKHRFAKDVRGFIDTDGSGSGKANLLQASAQVPALLKAYARSVRFPQATVFGNDFVQSGLTQASGDFEPLSRAGLWGLDVGAVKDTWGVHSHLDGSSRLTPGTLQDLGDTILAVSRELTETPTRLDVASERTVYYDLLGQTTLLYSMRTARWLTGGALGLLGLVLWQLVRRREVTVRMLVGSVGWTIGSALAGLVAALLSAIVVSLILQRPHGFYATPWLIVPSFALAGLCGVLVVHGLWRRREVARGQAAEQGALSAWAAGLCLWGLLLTLCSLGSLGLGYLVLWWLVPSSLALGIGLWLPQWRWQLYLASVAMGAASFIHLAVGLIPALIGMMIGMTPDPVPGDIKLALLMWLFVVAPLSIGGMAQVHRVGQLRSLLLCCVAIAGLGHLASALRHPYTAERPKRLMVVHESQKGQSALLVQSQDSLPVTPLIERLPQVQPVPTGEVWAHFVPPGWLPPFAHKLPAEPPQGPPPRLTPLSEQVDATSGVRTVTARLDASGWVTMLHIPHESLVGWSLAMPLPQPLPGERTITALFVAPSPEGQMLTLTLRGTAKVPVQVVQASQPEQSDALRTLRKSLPDWTTLNARTIVVITTEL